MTKETIRAILGKHLDGTEQEFTNATNEILATSPPTEQGDKEVREDLETLLMFTENDGTLLNGFRTKELILSIKAALANKK
jgi:hypothetical protein